MKETAKANRLIEESSPYLLQHAYNPVDWHPWTEQALGLAKEQDKPILVSIGYAACHWCHVMERESFENEEVAALMNQHFICIKVDREERPDVDQIYMDAVQAISGSGGWPLNVFLTPDAKPFYGGTYFPPREAHGRPSWSGVLQSVARSFRQNRDAIEEQAEKLTQYLAKNDTAFYDKNLVKGLESEQMFTDEDATKVFENLQQKFETRFGGFGNAPKFPNSMNLMYLLRYYHYSGEEAALQHVNHTLDRMIGGGIYDQVGGGFSRYSVDEEWLVPHFEKMLYDNALMVMMMCEAYQVTGNVRYRRAIEQTLEFVSRELTDEEGGFYASLDADTEGEEGKYYVWQKDEFEKVLGSDAELLAQYYDVTDAGNWEGKNILNTPVGFQQFVDQHGLDSTEFEAKVEQANEKLLAARENRIRPGLDDKQILGWNALMCSAYAKAYLALGHDQYRKAAEKNLSFLLHRLKDDDGGFKHTYKNGEAKYPAFLDDQALLITALLDVYQVGFDEQYIEQANQIMEQTLKSFGDEEHVMLYYTYSGQKDVLLRKKELYDGVMPSGNSAIASQLLRLGIMLDNNTYKQRAEDMLNLIRSSVVSYSTSFGHWSCLLLQYVYGLKEIAIVGKAYREYATGIQRYFIPNAVVMASDNNGQGNYPLLKDKGKDGETLIYICEDYSCQSPVSSIEAWQQNTISKA